jgi:GMP synthase-like glutamine amidotransferase
MSKAVILQHVAHEGPGRIIPLFRDFGIQTEVRRLYAGDEVPTDLDEIRVLIVLGGPMGVADVGNSKYPFLAKELDTLKRLVEFDRPVLGICLGAQLLAKAAHAPVRPAKRFEIGWSGVELTAAGAADPVLSRLPPSFDAFQWHYYEHDLPAGATELAANDVCTQAFRLGESAWGVQFHPEVTLGQVESWIGEEEDLPVDAAELLAETRRRIGGWNELGRNLCAGFVEAAERVGAPA